MPDEERIEQLELEVKVLRANNKGLKDKIDEQSKEIEELKDTRSIFNMGRRSYKNEIENKIKAEIEELEKLDFGTDLVSQFTANLTTITILQSLLEKELPTTITKEELEKRWKGVDI